MFSQEEGGIPEAHFSLHSLEEALVQAESISLLRDGDQSQGLGHTLWSQVAANASMSISSLLALYLVVQGSTLIEEQGNAGGGDDDSASHTSLDKLRKMAREVSTHLARSSVRVSNVNDMMPATGNNDVLEAMASLDGIVQEFDTYCQGLVDILNANPSQASLRQAETLIVKAEQEWSSALAKLKPNSIRQIDEVEVLFTAVGPAGAPQEARAMKVKKKLLDAMEMGPLLDATKESERRLAQVCIGIICYTLYNVILYVLFGLP